MFKSFIWNWFFRDNIQFVLDRIDIDEKLATNLKRIQVLEATVEDKNSVIANLTESISNQEKLIAALMDTKEKEERLEKYWNEKRPKTIWLYPGRPSPTSPNIRVNVDPRIFYQYDRTITRINGKNHDEVAAGCLKHVARAITYTSDPKEYWQFAYETQKRGRGDCEDGAILMADMMLMSGVPYWRVRLNAGDVQGGGHAWVTYLREKDDKWYVMDWCYWYNESKSFGKTWKKAEKYFNIWGSWNTKYVFGDLPKENEALHKT